MTSFGKKLVTQKVTTNISKLTDNACLWQKKLNFHFLISVFSGIANFWSNFPETGRSTLLLPFCGADLLQKILSITSADDEQTTEATTAGTTTEATTTGPGCTSDLVPIPDDTFLFYVDDVFAILQCKPGLQFPTSSDGAYTCVNNQWTATEDIPACIRRLLVRLLRWFYISSEAFISDETKIFRFPAWCNVGFWSSLTWLKTQFWCCFWVYDLFSSDWRKLTILIFWGSRRDRRSGFECSNGGVWFSRGDMGGDGLRNTYKTIIFCKEDFHVTAVTTREPATEETTATNIQKPTITTTTTTTSGPSSTTTPPITTAGPICRDCISSTPGGAPGTQQAPFIRGTPHAQLALNIKGCACKAVLHPVWTGPGPNSRFFFSLYDVGCGLSIF